MQFTQKGKAEETYLTWLTLFANGVDFISTAKA